MKIWINKINNVWCYFKCKTVDNLDISIFFTTACVLIFLVPARRRTSKSELLKKLSFQAWQSTSDIARFESYLQESKALDKLNKLRNFVCCKTTSMSRVQHVRSGMFFYSRGVSLYARDMFMYSKECPPILTQKLTTDNQLTSELMLMWALFDA